MVTWSLLPFAVNASLKRSIIIIIFFGGGWGGEGGWENLASIFLGGLIKVRIFGDIRVFKTIGRFMVVPAYPSHIVLRMKYNQTCFVVLRHIKACIVA